MAQFRVVDLTDLDAQFCGHILGSLGAEVIAVEPPGGLRSRHVGPFSRDRRDPEGSLRHWAFNRGKKSVVIDIDSPAGRRDLLELVARADVVIDSARPGRMGDLGLSYEDLAAINPGIVHASITAFGSTGPKATWVAGDLEVVASSGQAWLNGDADRAPLRISLPQAWANAAADAAIGILVALEERRSSGRGQHVDVSAQESMMQTTQSQVLAHAVGATGITRMAGGAKVGKALVQMSWACKDGHVSVSFNFGVVGRFTRNLMEWVYEEGFCDEQTRDKDWINYGTLLAEGVEPLEEYERVKRILDEFFLTRTKAELLEQAQLRRLLIVPVNTIGEVVELPHFTEREVWQDVDHGDYGLVRYPGALAKMSARPPVLGTAAPALGSSSVADFLSDPVRDHVAAGGSTPGGDGALSGLKVLDLSWVIAAPAATRILADCGATVVRVESATRLDTARGIVPFRDDVPGSDASAVFHNVNAGKRGLALNLACPEGREVLLDLVRWSDVVVESFSPKVMRSWGLDYEALRSVKTDVVMVSSSLMGQTGPLSALAGYGTMAAAISGWFNIVGWPDRPPAGPFSAYTDYVAPRLLACCILEAVAHLRSTGEGQYVDFAQAEGALQFLAPALLDYTVNGRNLEPAGNDDPCLAPHGIYRARGEDRWIAVSCSDDGAFDRLTAILGRPDLAGLTLPERLERRRELDEFVEAWTCSREVSEVEQILQNAGIAAHRVSDSRDCFEDPQLVHRQHYLRVSQSTQGTTVVEGSRFQLSRTPQRIERGGPSIGEDSWEILGSLPGYDDDRCTDLTVSGVLE